MFYLLRDQLCLILPIGEILSQSQKQNPVCLSVLSVKDKVINGSKEMKPKCMS